MIADYDVYEAKTKEKILAALFFFTLLTAAGYIFYGILWFGGILPLVWKTLIRRYCRFQAAKRKNRLLLQFRDFLYSLSASFATGRHMEEAMEEAENQLSDLYGVNGEMAAETGYMLRGIREAGETDLSVLESFADRACLEDVADFVQVFRACRETGGDLIGAVNKAAAVIGDKIQIETEIRVMVSQKKLEGRIITGMPAVVVLFLQVVSPDYLAVMYETAAGRILMTAALAAVAAAYVMIERITDIVV